MPEEVIWTSVFADGPGGGNPCPVVFGAAGWTDAQLQSRAARFGAETAYVLPSEHGGDVRLRYFVPQHEMEMCVHATVASTVLLGRAGRLSRTPARVETPLGVLAVDWDEASATVAQFPPVFGPVLPAAAQARVEAALRSATGGPIRSVSTARPKLMVPLPDEAALDALEPDYEQLWTVCDELGVTGFYPYARPVRGADVAARQFPARAGYVEDPATGVAACALGAHLTDLAAEGWQRWRIAQGRALGRPSIITAEVFVEAGVVTATRVGGGMRETPPAGPLDS